jgi:hypothetical protein
MRRLHRTQALEPLQSVRKQKLDEPRTRLTTTQTQGLLMDHLPLLPDEHRLETLRKNMVKALVVHLLTLEVQVMPQMLWVAE